MSQAGLLLQNRATNSGERVNVAFKWSFMILVIVQQESIPVGDGENKVNLTNYLWCLKTMQIRRQSGKSTPDAGLCGYDETTTTKYGPLNFLQLP